MAEEREGRWDRRKLSIIVAVLGDTDHGPKGMRSEVATLKQRKERQ